MSDVRPKWPFEKMSESRFRQIWGMTITRIVHHREMTGTDTSESWLTLHASGKKSGLKVPTDFFDKNGFFQVRPNYGSLVTLTYEGERAADVCRGIDKWEAKNKSDRKEFERLREKFGS